MLFALKLLPILVSSPPSPRPAFCYQVSCPLSPFAAGNFCGFWLLLISNVISSTCHLCSLPFFSSCVPLFILMLWPLCLSPDCPQWGFAFSAIPSQVHLSFLVFITVKGPVASQLEMAILPMVFWYVEKQGTRANRDEALHLLDRRPAYSLLIC